MTSIDRNSIRSAVSVRTFSSSGDCRKGFLREGVFQDAGARLTPYPCCPWVPGLCLSFKVG